MDIQKDFRDLLALFNESEVDYIIVGAYALAFHGVPRYTGDIDIFVKPDHDNAENIIRALRIFGFTSSQLTVHDFEIPENVIQLGVPPVRVDLITSISGVTWDGGRIYFPSLSFLSRFPSWPNRPHGSRCLASLIPSIPHYTFLVDSITQSFRRTYHGKQKPARERRTA